MRPTLDGLHAENIEQTLNSAGYALIMQSLSDDKAQAVSALRARDCAPARADYLRGVLDTLDMVAARGRKLLDDARKAAGNKRSER